MDRSTYYDRQGQIEKVEQDVNFDGKPDILVYYEAGKPKRQEIASKNDGRIDVWHFLDASGEIERKGQDTIGSGKPTIWVYYQNGQPVRSEE
jgi:antitoxin component YwqK of YwqJK toxin-antitoxin module